MKCNKVSSFIPMQIYRNPELLLSEGVQQRFGTIYIHNEDMQNAMKKIILYHHYAQVIYDNIILPSQQWECVGTQQNLNLRGWSV